MIEKAGLYSGFQASLGYSVKPIKKEGRREEGKEGEGGEGGREGEWVLGGHH